MKCITKKTLHSKLALMFSEFLRKINRFSSQELEEEIKFDCSENPDYVELKTEFSKLYQFKKR